MKKRTKRMIQEIITNLIVPEWAFVPDQWSLAFLHGLTKLAKSWEGKRVWEVGVGTGINLIFLRQLAAEVEWYFSDYNPRAVPLALSNLKTQEGLHPLFGSWDLLTPPHGGDSPSVDVVFGCIPQVPTTEMDLSVGDRRAHYYQPQAYPAANHQLGLGLVESLLSQARNTLKPSGQVVLNLGGRPGLPRLLSLFRLTGYSPNVVHSETIEQHRETSLASLVYLETTGENHFEFFADLSCRELINAHQAEAKRVRGEKVYHKIYVIAGTLA